MTRRELMALLGGAGAWPLAARAQQAGETRRIAVLMGSATTELGQSYLATFVRRLEQLGWAEGRNARIEVRWWAGGPDDMRPSRRSYSHFPRTWLMVFSNLALALFKPMARNVPMVFVGVGDPMGDGFVASLAHPGGNITGFAGTDGPIGGKWLEVLKETAPHVTRVMMIIIPRHPSIKPFGALSLRPHHALASRPLRAAFTMQAKLSVPFQPSRSVKIAGSLSRPMPSLGRTKNSSSRRQSDTACLRTMLPPHL